MRQGQRTVLRGQNVPESRAAAPAVCLGPSTTWQYREGVGLLEHGKS